MSPQYWLSAILAGATLSAAGVSQAGTLTYQEAVDLAARSAPSLEASALQLRAAEAAQVSSGRLPDPKLSFGVDNFPVTGPNAGRYGADFMTMTRVGIMQDLPNSARRRAEKADAAADISLAQADEAAQKRLVRTAAASAWLDLVFAEQRLAALDKLVSGLKDLWLGQPASVAAGSARPAVGLEPARLRATFDDRRSNLVADVAKARAELSRWTGDPAPEVVGPVPAFAIDAVKLRSQLDEDPRLSSLRAGALKADAAVSDAKAAERSDWSVSAAYARRDPMFGDMISLGATVSLPIAKSTRQDPMIGARVAQAGRARAIIEDARRGLVAALDGDLAEHLARLERLTRAREVLVPTAEQMAHLEVSSYAAGRADFTDLVASLTALADAQLDEIEREALVARHGAAILLMYGSDQ